MITAKNPDVSKVWHKNQFYGIHDAFPNTEMAQTTAKEMQGNIYPGGKRAYCKTVIVDLGPHAGRLR